LKLLECILNIAQRPHDLALTLNGDFLCCCTFNQASGDFNNLADDLHDWVVV
jgi:hypothetical protein